MTGSSGLISDVVEGWEDGFVMMPKEVENVVVDARRVEDKIVVQNSSDCGFILFSSLGIFSIYGLLFHIYNALVFVVKVSHTLFVVEKNHSFVV